MKLHEAIEKVIKTGNRAITIQQIANILNENKWYVKRDGTIITPSQISARVRKYSQLFDIQGSLVSLKNNKRKVILTSSEDNKNKFNEVFKRSLKLKFENRLFEINNFVSAGITKEKVPDLPGIYCIRIRTPKLLPKIFYNELISRNHNIIYIGIASRSLRKRFYNQELRAIGHGTFFRSLGAVLGYLPIKGSLKGKANKKNYKFSKEDENKIINWINSNLIVNWITYNVNLEDVESELITKYLPLLNISKNPLALTEIKNFRAHCVEHANS